MDGTLVDNHRAVKMAYRRAGIKMPDEAWGRPAQEWCPPDIHAEKKRLYPNFLREFGRILPAARLLPLLGGHVLTGASLEAVEATRKFLDLDFPLVGHSCSADTKLEVILDWAKQEPLTYFDDSIEFCKRVLDEGLTSITVVHVSEMDGVFHVYDNRHHGRVMRWTVSSWQLAVTSV